MYCTNCGNPVRDGVMFCPHCGRPLESDELDGLSKMPDGYEAYQPALPQGPNAASQTQPVSVAPPTSQQRPEEVPPRRRGHTVLIAITSALVVVVVALVAYLILGSRLEVNQGATDAPATESEPSQPPVADEGVQAPPVAAATEDPLTYDAVVATAATKTPVGLRYVSCDASGFPTMRLYLSVEDAAGTPVWLQSPDVVVLESISGGEQLRRAVTSIARLEGREGVSYGLAVDKSDSMDGDFERVRTILSQFVSSLDYALGDRAELISFDSFVMYMCTYTDDRALLLNGVANMETYGMTALYDALVDAITDASAQPGARCVIAFTDGMDNMSAHTADEVAALAASRSVPVFIVGTGGADATVLTGICDRSGGRYFRIDDITDLSSVLSGITVTERDMYCVEYVTDASSAAEAQRQLSVALADVTYGGYAGLEVTPTVPVTQAPHTSRYEVIRADVSWTEANAQCLARGGHLVTIGSEQEMREVSSLVDVQGLDFAWLGGYTSTRGSEVFGHWITGESFGYQAWYPGEPSRDDLDGTPEMYLIMWKIDGQWSWNDERDSPQTDEKMDYMLGNMGYVCEYE